LPRFAAFLLALNVSALFGVAVVCAGGTPLTTQLVTGGLERPVWVTHAPGDFDRIFILEKRGRIRIFNLESNTLRATPFLDIDNIVGGGDSDFSEQGLLGLTFDPDYATSGFFYVNFTNNNADTVVRRYSVSGDPDMADSASGLRILLVGQPFANHNGGWTEFGPDGMLYIALGDGGSFCDPGQRAQDITDELLGKILRIDPRGDDFPDEPGRNYSIPPDNPFVGITGDDEIWAYGLRNPWRNAFDALTGDLYIADVGQNAIEELDFQPAGAGGRNYGWDCKEGTACSIDSSGCTPSGCACADPMLIDPFHQYTHAEGCSITGGVVYRGCAIPDLDGTYFFADFCSARIWSLRYDGVTVTDFQDRTAELNPPGPATIDAITSFGVDAYGEMYICDQFGEVYKIVPATPVGPDCNKNGRRDECDILDGTSADDDGNGVPDECESCPGDLDGDGAVGLGDLSIFLANYGTTSGAGPEDGDLDGDGDVDFEDLAVFLSLYGTTC